jgi:glyoxylase-like metal-dependent hydrolase (beta-lactamase superfamily II)
VVEIIQCRVGSDNFAYLVICPATGQALAIDPGHEPAVLLGEVQQRGLTLAALANTHGHADHTAGNAAVRAATGAPLAAHPADLPEADVPLQEGRLLTIGQVAVSVLHTPGHTPGSVVFHAGDALITGDTLFVTRCGRADLPGSDPAALYASLRRLASFPPATRIYPGHDYGPRPVSTVAFEQEHNPYLRCPDLASFIRLRMNR